MAGRSRTERESDISCGVDVGKWPHHFAAIGRRTGETPLDEKTGRGEGEIRGAPSRILESGRTTIVAGQPGGMSAPLLAAADDMGVPRGFITPEAMAQAVETYGGEVKADAHDALVTAEVSAGLPRLAKPVGGKSGARLRLAALMSCGRELTEEATRASSRLHDLLPSTCPALEAHLGGERIQSQLRLAVLARCGGRSGLKKAGRGNVGRRARPKKGMGPAALSRIDELLDAVSRQTASLPGTEGTEEPIRLEAAYLLATLKSRTGVAARRDAALAEMPEAQTLMALPGLGAVTCAAFLSEVGDISRFDSAARLAAHAGLAPRAGQSGKAVHSVAKPRGGNRRLKRVLVLSASKSTLFCDESRACYDRKRAEGRGHNSAVTALARRRLNVMYAMLRDGKPYEKNNG